MFRVLALLCLVAPAAFGNETQDVLWVKHTVARKTSLGTLPASLAEFTRRNWVTLENPPDFSAPELKGCTVMTHTNGVGAGGYLAPNGLVAAYYIAFPKARLENLGSNMESSGFISWTANVNGSDIEYWATYVRFGSCDCAETTTELVQDGKIYMIGADGSEIALSTTASANKAYQPHRCREGYGTYHLVNLNSRSECTQSMNTSFIISDVNTVCNTDSTTDNVLGVGIYFVGSDETDNFKWTVDYTVADLYGAMSEYPTCLEEAIKKNKASGFEMYIRNPENMKCSAQ